MSLTQRFIRLVSPPEWKQRTVYDPKKTFAEQVEENEKYRTYQHGDRFTELLVHNALFSFTTHTKNPTADSKWFATAKAIEGAREEKIVFTLFGRDRSMDTSFENANEIDAFLRSVKPLDFVHACKTTKDFHEAVENDRRFRPPEILDPIRGIF